MPTDCKFVSMEFSISYTLMSLTFTWSSHPCQCSVSESFLKFNIPWPAIGMPQFISVYIEHKVFEWINEIECLSPIAITQPHTAFTHIIQPYQKQQVLSPIFKETSLHTWPLSFMSSHSYTTKSTTIDSQEGSSSARLLILWSLSPIGPCCSVPLHIRLTDLIDSQGRFLWTDPNPQSPWSCGTSVDTHRHYIQFQVAHGWGLGGHLKLYLFPNE